MSLREHGIIHIRPITGPEPKFKPSADLGRHLRESARIVDQQMSAEDLGPKKAKAPSAIVPTASDMATPARPETA
jgi:hypothetical protein